MKSNLKDLGILVDDMLSYKNQQMAADKKAQQKSTWFFKNNMEIISPCHIDYGSILWAPVSAKLALIYMEGPLPAFTRHGKDMYDKNY